MPDEAPKPADTPPAGDWFRGRLAMLIVLVSLVLTAILAGFAIYFDTHSAKDILTMVLPMIGTWVGTVLAFYFGREQLEAATRSVTAIARELTPEEKLRAIKVTEKMIPLTNAFVTTADPATVKLLDAIKGLETSGKGDRLPVLTSDKQPKHVIHRSTIDRFIVQQATKGKNKDELASLTLADLLADNEFKDMLQTTVAVVPEGATLADAKRAMDALKWCQDVMITPAGSSAEPASGWITNGIIRDNSKV
jgi:hypothetical protein